MLPFFMYLTYRVGSVRREVCGETQKSLAEMTAATEETLQRLAACSCTKTFGQQETAIRRFRAINRSWPPPDPPGDGRAAGSS